MGVIWETSIQHDVDIVAWAVTFCIVPLLYEVCPDRKAGGFLFFFYFMTLLFVGLRKMPMSDYHGRHFSDQDIIWFLCHIRIIVIMAACSGNHSLLLSVIKTGKIKYTICRRWSYVT